MSELIAEIAKLNLRDRIWLVQEIMQTIAKDAGTEHFSLTELQRQELNSRSMSVRNGEVSVVSWESMLLKLAQRYAVQN